MAGLAAHWQARKRATLPLSPQLCNTPRNYVVKREMNRVIYAACLFMSGMCVGLGGSLLPFLKGEITLSSPCL